VIYTVLALPFVLLGAFTRTFASRDSDSCFYVDGIDWGPNCFGQGAITPFLFHYGCMAVGLALLAAGFLKTRGKKWS